MATNSYSEKLRDPRWQKKRLEILEQADWTCNECADTTEQLHVHHLLYFPHRMPWEYPDICYVVLCATCHDNYKHNVVHCGHSDHDTLITLITTLGRTVFDRDDAVSLANGLVGFFKHCPRLTPPTYYSVIEWALKDPTMVSLMVDGYLDYLTGTNRKGLADMEREYIKEGFNSECTAS